MAFAAMFPSTGPTSAGVWQNSGSESAPSLLAAARLHLMSGQALTFDALQHIHSRTSPDETLSTEAIPALVKAVTSQITEHTFESLLQHRIPNELVVRVLTHVVDGHRDLQYASDHEDELFEAMIGASTSAKVFHPAMREACLLNMRCKIAIPSRTVLDLTASGMLLAKVRHISLVFPVTRRGRHWTDSMPFTETLSHIKSSMPQLRTLVCYFGLRRTALATPPDDDSMQPWVDGVVSLVKDMRSIMPTVALGMKFQGYHWEEGPVVFQVIRKQFHADDDPFENGWALVILALTPYGEVEAVEGESAEDLAALLSSKNAVHERQLRGTVRPSLYP